MLKRPSLEDIQALLSLIAAPVLVLDLETGRPLLLNEKAVELTGYDLEDIRKVSAQALFADENQNIILAMMELSRNQSGGFLARETGLELRRKTGRICPVSLSAARVDLPYGGALVLTLEDLSELRLQEKERQVLLNQSFRVTKLADLGRLAGGVAHELNNPLAILLGHCEKMEILASRAEVSREEIGRSLVPMKKAALRMSKIVSTMVSTIRQQPRQFEICALSQVVQDALVLFKDLLASHSIDLKIEIDESQILCESSQVEQILSNLIRNACSALNERKDNRQIVIRSLVSDSSTSLEVWNNGPAISPEVQASLFTPFLTTKEVGEGPGLGLYLCDHIMKSHSGDLSFQSSEDGGTSFFINFPKIKSSVKISA